MLGWIEAQSLSEVLRTISTLMILNLNDNSIGEKGAQALSAALKTNPSLRTSMLRENAIGDRGAGGT